MAGSLNKVTLIGNLGKDPEIKTFQNGGRRASFSIATSESWKDKQTGEQKEKTQWHNVVVSNEGLIGVVERFLRKGSKVYVEGALENREYEKDGMKRSITEVVLKAFGGTLIMLDGKQAAGEPHAQQGASAALGGYGAPQATGGYGGGYGAPIDDSVPF